MPDPGKTGRNDRDVAEGRSKSRDGGSKGTKSRGGFAGGTPRSSARSGAFDGGTRNSGSDADAIADRFRSTFGGGYLANAAPGLMGNPRNENAGFGVGNSAPPGGGGLTMADLQQLLGQYLQQPPQPDPFQFQFMPQQQSFMQQYPQPSFMGTPQNIQELYQMYQPPQQQPQQQNMQQPSYGDWLTNRSF